MKKAEELHLLEISKRPSQKIIIDIIGPLPKSNNKNTIVISSGSIYKDD